MPTGVIGRDRGRKFSSWPASRMRPQPGGGASPLSVRRRRDRARIDQAIEALRHDHFDAIFSDSADFLPLERALVSQQANLILNTIGEGVCIVDGEGRCNWMNKKMQAWPARVHEKIRRTCQEAFELFSKQVSPADRRHPRLLQPLQTLRPEHRRPAVPGDDRLAGDQSRRAGRAGRRGRVGRDRHAAAAAEDRRDRQGRPRAGAPRSRRA